MKAFLRDFWVRVWRRSQRTAERWGVNPLLLVGLYLSLYVWVPVASFLPLPLWFKGGIAAILYIAPFVYGGVGIVRRCIYARGENFQVRVLDQELFEKLFDDFPHWVRVFWRKEPWGEHLRCPECSAGAGMYSNAGAISYERAQDEGLGIGDRCPACGASLAFFWSDANVQRYFAEMMTAPDYTGVVAFVGEEFAGWAVGYRKWWMDENVFYVDTIAIVPQFRRRPWRYRLMNVFTLHLMVPALKKGYRQMIFRTHLKAPWVGGISKVYGFCFTGVVSKESPDRGYWLASLNWLTIVRAWAVIKIAGLADAATKTLRRVWKNTPTET